MYLKFKGMVDISPSQLKFLWDQGTGLKKRKKQRTRNKVRWFYSRKIAQK